VSSPPEPASQPSYDGYMTVPMRITGLRPGTAAFWRTEAEWSEGGQRIWSVGGLGGRFQDDLIREKMGSLLGFTTDIRAFDCDDNFQFPRSLARRYVDKPLSLHAKVYLYLTKIALAADAPIRDGRFRHAGASFSVNDLARSEHGVSMTVTDRFERDGLLAFFGMVWPRSMTWALVNRAKREMRFGKQDPESNPIGLQLNMVSVVSERIAIGDIASPAWLQGARLVAFDFAGDHNIERSLDEEPFHFTYLTPEESKYRPRKTR
jgi:hypothetical protein